MNQLQNLQHTFQTCVLNSDNSSSTSWISASGRVTPEVQLSAYSYAYKARLLEVLMNDFPAMLMAIGEEQFFLLADDYINAHPSQYFSLRDFGNKMMAFVLEKIKSNEGDVNWQDKLWLYELGLFEWTLGQAFDAVDDKIFTEQDMSVIASEDWPYLKFKLHSSVQRLDFEWNTPEIWQSLTADTPTEVEAAKDEQSSWLIWREQLVTRFRSLGIDEQIALDTVRKGGSFTDVCEALASIMEEENVPMHAASLLKVWITQGLIRELE